MAGLDLRRLDQAQITRDVPASSDDDRRGIIGMQRLGQSRERHAERADVIGA